MKANIYTLSLILMVSVQGIFCHAATRDVQMLTLITTSGWKVEAELTYPQNHLKPAPLVIFAHGGGCKDIDCKVGPTSYPFWKELAGWFHNEGFAVIRFYRGSTRSVRDDIELLLNAYEQAELLKGIDQQKIGFYGHSEGTWQSAVATQELKTNGHQVGFLILNGTFIVDLTKHSDAQLREIFRPIKNFFVDHYLNLQDRQDLSTYLRSWSIPENLISRLHKSFIVAVEVDSVRSEFLKMMSDYIDQDEKLRSWKSLESVQQILPTLTDLPILINQGLSDQETPFAEVEYFLSCYPQKNIVFNPLAGLNHYFTGVSVQNKIPQRSWAPIDQEYFRTLRGNLKLIGL